MSYVKCNKIFQVQRSRYVKHKMLEFLPQAESTLVPNRPAYYWFREHLDTQIALKSHRTLASPSAPHSSWAAPACPAGWRVHRAVRTGKRDGQTLVSQREFQAGLLFGAAQSCSAKPFFVIVTQCHSLPSQSKIIWPHFLSKLIILFFWMRQKHYFYC